MTQDGKDFNLGLKLWSTNECYAAEAKRLVDEKICAYVELYALPGTFEKFGGLWKSLNLPMMIHAPHFMHGVNLARADQEPKNRTLAEEAFRYADLLEAKWIIFHPGISGELDETIRQLNSWPASWKNRVLIENKPYKTIADNDDICNGHSPEQIKRVLDETGVGFCLDLGHAICSSNGRNVDPWTDIEAFEKLEPTMYHLSDNESDSAIDKHWHLGRGDYDFPKMFEIIDTRRPISLETPKDFPDSLADFICDCEILRNINPSICNEYHNDPVR